MIQTAGKVSGVQMMLLPVSDMAQSIRFYGELLGMSVDQDDDLDALGERLRAAGITIEGPRDQSWGERMIATSDPDGYHIYLVEPRSGKSA